MRNLKAVRSCVRVRFALPENPPLNHLTLMVFLAGILLGSIKFAQAHQTKPAEEIPKSSSAQVQEETITVDLTDQDGPRFQIDQFILEYKLVEDEDYNIPADHPQLIPLSEIMQMEIKLAQTAEGYVRFRHEYIDPNTNIIRERIRPDEPSVTIRLADIEPLPMKYFYASAIDSIQDQIIFYFTSKGLSGILVTPHMDDINLRVRPLEDLRPGGQGPLRLQIWTGVVTQLRTVASGKRILDAQDRIDHKWHQRMKQNSPVQPFIEGEVETPPRPGWPFPAILFKPRRDQRKDLLRKDLLDDYLFFLNRHPGRRVDAAVSSAGEPGQISLDFLVTETKPWMAYFQILNTGTKSTNRWRELFGFINNQLTNNDDILSVNYDTAGFNEAHLVIAYYEAPLLHWDRIRWRISGLTSEFDASEFAYTPETFHGEEWNAGGEIIANVYQNKELFVDVVAGLRRQNIMVYNPYTETTGKEDFLLPRVGIDLEQREETFSIFGSVDLEWNCAGAANTDDVEVEKLGRLNTENEWKVIHWRLLSSIYLDPWLMGDKWNFPTEEEGKQPNLTHELVLNFSGQYSPERLIPRATFPVGGMYTVRGYPETIATGDSAIMGKIEYGYHLPRAFPVNKEPDDKIFGKTFRWAPQRPYDQPDWDLVLRAFFDVAQFRNSDKLFTEQNKTLMGCGLGVELQMFRNFSVRCDWGFALKPYEAGRDDIKSGDNRFHLVGTFSF